jgi:hypothetical protein
VENSAWPDVAMGSFNRRCLQSELGK